MARKDFSPSPLILLAKNYLFMSATQLVYFLPELYIKSLWLTGFCRISWWRHTRMLAHRHLQRVQMSDRRITRTQTAGISRTIFYTRKKFRGYTVHGYSTFTNVFEVEVVQTSIAELFNSGDFIFCARTVPLIFSSFFLFFPQIVTNP